MSEFPGSLSEFPEVSNDRFNCEILKSTVYFVSHCGRDHMVSLNEPELFERSKHFNLKIFCHKVSAGFLSVLALYVNLTSYIIPLDSDNKITWNVSSEEDETNTLTVTRIPASDCPGSVRFLLVSKEKSILFTGHFRWQVGHTKQINHLFDNLQETAVHIFDNIYNDTFCKTDSNFIPRRKSCLSAIFQAVSAWLCSFQNNVIHFLRKLAMVMSF